MHTIRVLIRSSKVMYYFPKNNNIFALIFHFTPPYNFIADYQSLTAIKLFSHFSPIVINSPKNATYAHFDHPPRRKQFLNE